MLNSIFRDPHFHSRCGAIAAIFFCISRGFAQLPAEPAAGTGPLGVIHLANGDRLTAVLVEYDVAAGRLVVAAGPAIRNPIEFDATALTRFERPPATASAPAEPWSFTLLGGDRVKGDWLAMDATTARIHHPTLGEIVFPRQELVVITSVRDSYVIYQGPEAGEEWSVPQGLRRLNEPVLNIKANEILGRSFKDLPNRLRLDFKISSFGPHSSLAVNLGANDGPRRMGEMAMGINLQIHGHGYITLIRRTPRSLIQMGNIRLSLSEISECRASLLVDTEKNRVVVMINEAVVGDWANVEIAEQLGSWLLFTSNSGIQIRNLRLSRWNGKLPSEETQTIARHGEMVFLQNEDVVTGELKSIGPETATLSTSFGELEVPLDRIMRIEMHTAKTPATAKSVAKVVLFDHTELSLQVERIKDEVLVGRHPSAGSLRIPMSLIRLIVWNGRTDKDTGRESVDPSKAGRRGAL